MSSRPRTMCCCCAWQSRQNSQQSVFGKGMRCRWDHRGHLLTGLNSCIFIMACLRSQSHSQHTVSGVKDSTQTFYASKSCHNTMWKYPVTSTVQVILSSKPLLVKSNKYIKIYLHSRACCITHNAM